MHRARARTIELDEQNPLPRAENKRVIFNSDHDSIAGDVRPKMRIRVPIIMIVVRVRRDEPIEKTMQVRGNRAVRMLVDDDTARCMKNTDEKRTAPFRMHRDLIGYVMHRTGSCVDRERSHIAPDYTNTYKSFSR